MELNTLLARMNQNLAMVKGDTAVFDITCTTAAGAAFDISGATIYFTVKDDPSDADAAAIFQKSTASGISIISGAGGTAQVVTAAADTSSFNASEHGGNNQMYWDCQVIKSGRTYTVARGRLTILAQYTVAAS